MNKRGISAVVATVLIILITVAGVTLIWGAIIPMIRDNLDFSALEGRVHVVTSEGYTFYDAAEQKVNVQVKRDMDDGVMDRINLIFDIDGNSVSSSVVAPDPGNTKTYTFDVSGYGEPSGISVAPIFAVGEREKIGDVTSNVKVGKGAIDGTKSKVELYDLGEEYYGDYSTLPSSGIVSLWKFSGDAEDSFGINNGTLHNGATVNNGELILDGINSTMTTTTIGIIDGTISFWVYVEESDTYGVILGERNVGCYSSAIYVHTGNFRTYQNAEFAIVPMSPDKWTNHVVVSNDTDKDYYVDGNFVVRNSTMLTNLNNLLKNIGSSCNGNHTLDGKIDNIMLFDRPLAAEEVTAIYEAQKKG